MASLKTTKDLIMLLLYAPGPSGDCNEPIPGQTRLMKMIFLFEKELKKEFNKAGSFDDTVFPQFQAYDYGPYAPQVYADLEWLVNMGFVEPFEAGSGEISVEEQREFDYWTATGSEDDDLDIRQVGKSFKLTAMGMKFVTKMLSDKWSITPDQIEVLKEFKSRCVEASLRALLHYVYSRYPEMTEKSKIKHDIIGS